MPLARTNSGFGAAGESGESGPNKKQADKPQIPDPNRTFSESNSVPEEMSGHGLLAPFTPGLVELEKSPLIIAKSKGIYVYDEEGKEYIDALAGLWCLALGGSEQRLVEAAERQLKTLPFYHSFWNRTTRPALELASELIDLFKPTKMGKVFFTQSGSEANDTQVKLVWYYNNALGRHEKKKFISRQKAYHGVTYVSSSLSGLPAMHQNFDVPAPFVKHVDCPHYWRYHLPGESEEDFATRLANNLEKTILEEGPETVAAFIAEPVMGAGGVMPPPRTYFDKVQKILKKHDILFIVDEVVCAFGRLGTMFGSDYYNLKPDLVSIAKALSSAYMPIGAVLVSEEIAEVIGNESKRLGNFGHGFTYSGHPVSCSVSLEAIKIYKERDIPGHVKKVSPTFQNRMKALADSPIVGEIRGLGLIMAVEFVADKEKKTAFPADWGVGARFLEFCKEEGLLVRVAGDVVMLSPPLIITEAEIKKFISIFESGLRKTEKWVARLRDTQTEAAASPL